MRIKEFRKAMGLTQKQLGDLVGASSVSISFYENGQQQPDLTMIKKIAEVLHTSVDVLLDYNQTDLPKDEFDFREKLRCDPDFRMLYNVAKKSKPESLRAATAVLQSLKGESESDE